MSTEFPSPGLNARSPFSVLCCVLMGKIKRRGMRECVCHQCFQAHRVSADFSNSCVCAERHKHVVIMLTPPRPMQKHSRFCLLSRTHHYGGCCRRHKTREQDGVYHCVLGLFGPGVLSEQSGQNCCGGMTQRLLNSAHVKRERA